MLNSKRKPARFFFPAYPNPVIPPFYAVSSEKIALTAGISAILHVEPVAVDGADHLPGRIDIPIRQDAAGVRAFPGKSEQLVPVPSQGQFFIAGLHQAHIIVLPVYLGFAFGYFMPFPGWFGHGVKSKGFGDRALICESAAKNFAADSQILFLVSGF
jgi:hypothetical protein